MPRTTDSTGATTRTTTARRPPAPAARLRAAPVKLHRPDVALSRQVRSSSRAPIFLSGMQALVRVLLDQHRADRAPRPEHRRRSSPATRARRSAASTRRSWACASSPPSTRCTSRPGLNEELAATAVYGSQLTGDLPGPRFDGVVGVLVRQEPGPRPRDRRAAPRELRRHQPARAARSRSSATTRACKSSTLPSAARGRRSPRCTCPTFFPGDAAGGPRPRPARDRLLARVGPVERAEGRHRTSPTAPARSQVWPERVGPVMPSVEYEGKPYRARAQRQPARARSRWSSSARCSARASSSRASTRALNQLNPVVGPDARRVAGHRRRRQGVLRAASRR